MSSNYQDLPFWISCNTIGIGPKTFKKLLKYYKSAQKIWNANSNDLRKFDIKGKTLKNILERRKKINPEKEIIKIKKYQINFIILKDKDYPKILKEIENPPYVLFYKGNLRIFQNLSIAVVGTRKITQYGKRVCEKIVYGLAKNRLNIVSGLALGIDAVAHRTALESGGTTIAVLGTGLDFIYPPANYQLAQKIIKNGLIISEFPLGTRGYRSNFPQRNRIISGLSLGALVIEAAARSGALITAYYALEQNREVFTIPGSIFSPQSEGCNNLIKMGAKAITNYEDIMDELNIKNKLHEWRTETENFETETEKKIWDLLHNDIPTHIDKIIEEMKKPASEISSVLTLMEIRGLIKNLGAQQYVKKS